MSDVIELLERMGADAQLRHASQEELADAIAQTQVDAAVGAAIIARSTDEIYALLWQKPMFHIQMDPGKEEEEEDEEEGDEEEKPSQKRTAVWAH